jgi:hypothetical protein
MPSTARLGMNESKHYQDLQSKEQKENLKTSNYALLLSARRYA